MNLQFSNPSLLICLPLAVSWVAWLTFQSDSSVGRIRIWVATVFRLLGVTAICLSVAGLQWLRPQEGMNVIFLLDRSQSVPADQQEASIQYVNEAVVGKMKNDMAGVLVFGGDAGIEQMVQERVELGAIQAVLETDRTDIAAAIRLATASFPQYGQKRMMLVSDGNENLGDSLTAIAAAQPLEVSLDVVPLGADRRRDIAVQRLGLPGNVKKGSTFEAKIFALSDEPGPARVRLFRNHQLLGEQEVRLEKGKNLLAFPQTLPNAGFYTYDVEIIAPGDRVAQNNRAINFVNVMGDPRILLVSNQPTEDQALADALRSSQMEVIHAGLSGFPDSLAEIQSYDAIFLSNIAAGDLGRVVMRRVESAVCDFGVGLVCVGGDQAYAAGGYRGTPLERTLPVDMELSSKKVLPNGALAMVMHGMEFNDGNQVARQVALGVLNAMGPDDELGIVLWDGQERWLFPMTKIGEGKDLGQRIMGMNQGDLPSFHNIMTMAHEGLRESTANLKHLIVFSDGDPGAPSEALMEALRGDRITVSSVLIAGHAGPEIMQWIAEQGGGRFYDVRSPDRLPQIFIKETSVILKSAISENSFRPQRAAGTELIRGFSGEFPLLRGHVATTAKGRAEVPLLTESGDPLLAHWQYGLGRAAAFTSDAKARWASSWLEWGQYRQFWSQIAQWALRRVENTDFASEVSIDKGRGVISVEAVDEQGNFRNFLELNARVMNPNGESQALRIEQTAPGRYEARFDASQVGAYTINLMHMEGERLLGTQMIGASLNASPEYSTGATRWDLLNRLAEVSGGTVFPEMTATANPFGHDRRETFQPLNLWEWLLKFAILLLPLDIGLRRIQIDREQWDRAWRSVIGRIAFWNQAKPLPQRDESLSALLNRRDQVRAHQEREVRIRPSTSLVERPVQENRSLPIKGAPELDAGLKTAKVPRLQEPDQAEAPSTASQLLEAKKRARRRR